MKKHFLLIALLTMVFLGLGNYSFAETYNECTARETAAGRDGSACDYLYTQNAGDTTTNATPGCNVSTSKLSGDTKAYVTAIGLTCACTGGYGEFYDVNLNKTSCELCSRDDVCCGVKLNTAVPFIGNCMETEDQSSSSTLTQENAFPTLMGGLTKILVTVILIVSFVLIVVGGVMIATAGANPANATSGRKLIMKVVIGIALLGASGVILRLINPNFFG